MSTAFWVSLVVSMVLLTGVLGVALCMAASHAERALERLQREVERRVS